VPVIVQLNVPLMVAPVPPQPAPPGLGIRKLLPKMSLCRLRMLIAIGSICAAVKPKAGAIRAAEVVPSAFLGKAWRVGLTEEPFGSIPFLARTACKLKNQKPPIFGA